MASFVISADTVNCHTSKDREIKIYIQFSLVARPTILGLITWEYNVISFDYVSNIITLYISPIPVHRMTKNVT